MERQVLFILSTNYAGSHYASLLLGSHSCAAHLGEAKRLRKPDRPKPVCSACGDAECALFRGVTHENLDRLYQQVFENVGPGITLLVDNSKQPRWARRFLGRTPGTPGAPGTPYRLRFLHLIRDPRALVRRWTLDHPTFGLRLDERLRLARKAPGLALPVLLSPQRRVWVYKWLAQNQAITRFLRENRLDHRVLTYRDLALETERELRRLDEWLGLPFEPGQIEYWRFPHHGSQKAAYEWVKQRPERFLDTRWREFLSPAESDAIRRSPRIAAYLAELGLVFAEDGLTRAAPASAPADSPRARAAPAGP